MRSLTIAAANQSQLQHGAFPTHVLEVRWTGGTVYYANRDLTTPITAQGRVIEWNDLSLDAGVEKVGGYSQLNVKLADHDGALRALAAVEPGFGGTLAYLHLWFVGTDWSDRVTLFAGVVAKRGTAGSDWDLKTGTWSLKLDGYEKQLVNDLGQVLRREEFPDVKCSLVEGQIIPIAFGDPVRRVPAVVIDRPGSSQLGSQLLIQHDYLYLYRNAQEDGFTLDTLITIYIGVPGNVETLTGGFFDAADRRKFTIYSRSAFLCDGVTAGEYAEAGRRYLLIQETDVPDPATSRIGYLIYLYLNFEWFAYHIDLWNDVGAQIACLNVSGITVPGGTYWRISSRPSGHVPVWPPGTAVWQGGDWIYAVNFLPSEEVIRVEARGPVQNTGGGSEQRAWYSYNDTYWEANLNNQDFNEQLGREEDDEGLTTISLSQPPFSLGLDEETVYVTLRATMNAADAAEDNPAEVIRLLLTHEFLGGLSADFIRASSFDAAAAAITEVFAFAITDPRPLLEHCSELAFQAGCLFFWDQGRAHLVTLDLTPTYAERDLTLSADNVQQGTLKIADPGDIEKVSELTGEWLPYPTAEERRIVRRSPDAIAAFGEHKKSIKLWGYQDVQAVARMVEFWLQAFLTVQRQVTAESFLNAIAIQPGDVVGLQFSLGDGATLFNAAAGRVSKLRHTFGDAQRDKMEELQFTVDLKLWDVTIEAVEPDEDECEPLIGDVIDPDDGLVDPPPDDRVSTTTTTTTTTTSTTSSSTTTEEGATTTSSSSTSSSTTTSCGDACLDLYIPAFNCECPINPGASTYGNRWIRLASTGVTSFAGADAKYDRADGVLTVFYGNFVTGGGCSNFPVAADYEVSGPYPTCGTVTATLVRVRGQAGFTDYCDWPSSLTLVSVNCSDPTSSTSSTTAGSTSSTSSTSSSTTTSGGSTTSTTTTQPDCSGDVCQYEFNGTVWTTMPGAGCSTPGCNCGCPPAITGSEYLGQTVSVACQATSPNCGTTTTGTTSTTSTSTTTAAPTTTTTTSTTSTSTTTAAPTTTTTTTSTTSTSTTTAAGCCGGFAPGHTFTSDFTGNAAGSGGCSCGDTNFARTLTLVGPQTIGGDLFDCVWVSDTIDFGSCGSLVMRVKYFAGTHQTFVDVSPSSDPTIFSVRYRREGCPVAGTYGKIDENSSCSWAANINLFE